MTVPLFEGGSNIAEITGGGAAYQSAFQQARSQRDQTIADLAAAWAALQDAIEQVSVRRAFLEASRERAEIIHSQYTSGLADFQDFDIAEQELADSEKAYVDSLAAAAAQEARWQAATGLTLEDALHPTP